MRSKAARARHTSPQTQQPVLRAAQAVRALHRGFPNQMLVVLSLPFR